MINYKEIQKKFNEVISHSQCISDPITDSLFEAWAKNKSRFVEKWGGLMVELPNEITLDKPEEDKRIIYSDFVADAVIFCDKSQEMKEFFSEQTYESFYQNKVSSPYRSKDGMIKINAGAKISKSLKFFFSNKDMLDKFQVRMSRIIQDCKITGTMVMSVHPLDFLSTAETAHNWHSCHSLDGEYRAGNLSYMMDKHTFVVYLKADRDYELPNFPFEWNSKKWRVLMYLSEDEKMLVSGRQYPFSNEFSMKLAREELVGKFYDLTDFTENWVEIERCIRNIMVDGIGSLQYNDCLNSPSYKPVAIYHKSYEDKIFERLDDRMEIGEAVECLECGIQMVSSSNGMICDECAGYSYCDYCGEPGYEDEMYYLEGSHICECCWDDNATFCEGCEETFHHYESGMVWDEETDSYYCPDCYESLLETREQEDYIYGEL